MSRYQAKLHLKSRLDVIRQQDGPNTFFYCDPPYLSSTRSGGTYDCEVDEEHHGSLLALLKTIQGKVMLSGYRSALYDTELADWRLVEFDRAKNSSSAKSKERAVECVWMNY